MAEIKKYEKPHPLCLINIPILRGKMAEKGYTQTSLAKAVGISRNSLSYYMKNPEKMPYWVMREIAYYVCNHISEARGIFMQDPECY